MVDCAGSGGFINPNYLHWASCRWMIQVDCAGSRGWSTYDPQTPLLTLGFMSTDETGGLCRKWRMEYLREVPDGVPYLWSLNPATYTGLHVDGWDGWTVLEVENGVLTIPQPRYLHWASCRRMRLVDCAGSGGWSTYGKSRMEYLWSPNPATYTRLHVNGWDGWTVPEVKDGIPKPRYLRWASCRQMGCAGSGGWST